MSRPRDDGLPRKRSVLLVDDVAGLRRLFRIILEDTGEFEVVGEAGDGEVAIRLARDLRPALILLDLSMPGMDGLEALPILRRVANDAKIVVLSGFERERMESIILKDGASAYLEKGVGPEDFLRVIRRVLAMSPQRESESGLARPRVPAEGRDDHAFVNGSPSPTPFNALAATLARLSDTLRDAELETRSAGPPAVHDLVQTARGLADLVKDRAHAESVSASRGERKCAPIADALEHAVAILSPKVREASATITHDPFPDVDIARLTQIFENILDNALKFRGRDPAAVHVNARVEGVHLHFTVRDNGIGFSGRARGSVFDRDPLGAPESGLGLAICRHLVEEEACGIWIDDADESGSIMHFTLPFREQLNTAEAPDAAPRASTPARLNEASALARAGFLEVDRLIHEAREKDELFSIVSHELRTPLTPLLTQLYLLGNGSLGALNAKQARAVDVAVRNTERLRLLVEDALAAAGLDAGRLKLFPEEFEVLDLLRDAVASFEAPAAQAGIHLESHATEEVVLVADPRRIEQVLYNLIANADQVHAPWRDRDH